MNFNNDFKLRINKHKIMSTENSNKKDTSNELYTLLPNVFYELQETEENKLTIQITQDNTINFTLEDWNDFATMEISKDEAVKLAEEIIKHCG